MKDFKTLLRAIEYQAKKDKEKFASVKSYFATITPAMAEILLENNVNNREVRKGQVNTYANDMKSGNWQFNGASITFDDHGRLLDGQHRLMACRIANANFDTLLTIGVPSRDSKDRSVQRTIDCGGFRSICDALTIEQVKEEGCPVPRNIARILTKINAIVKGLPAAGAKGMMNTKLYGTYGNKSLASTDIFFQNEEIVRNLCKWGVKLYKDAPNFFSRTKYTQADFPAYAFHLIVNKGWDETLVKSFFEELVGLQPTTSKALQTAMNKIASLVKANRGKALRGTIMSNYLIYAWNAYASGKADKAVKLTEKEEESTKVEFLSHADVNGEMKTA